MINISLYLVNIFHRLKYLYLSENKLSALPRNFFLKFPNLKWLDVNFFSTILTLLTKKCIFIMFFALFDALKLRNNELHELPARGLTNQCQLRYLLLENNQITALPNEIADLGCLTALSLTDNPIGESCSLKLQPNEIGVRLYFRKIYCTQKHILDSFLTPTWLLMG